MYIADDSTSGKLKAEFLSLYLKYRGNTGLVCETLRISRKEVARWMKEDVEFKEEVDSVEERMIDFVENALYGKVADGDTQAIMFFLKTKGKKRGYGEKVEEGDKRITINILNYGDSSAVQIQPASVPDELVEGVRQGEKEEVLLPVAQESREG